MRYFTVAADFKLETLDCYEQLNNTHTNSKIYETFGQINIGNMFGSGRPADMLPSISMDDLSRYVEYGNKKGINFNYILNTTCVGNKEFTQSGLDEIGRFFSDLESINVKTITLSMPPLIEFCKKAGFKFEIKASTLCDIMNANKALAYKNMGADRIVVHESINRDFRALKNICRVFGDNVEIIVNSICNKNCAYRPFHQNQGSHDVDMDVKSTRYYSHRCVLHRLGDLDNFYKLNWIRPEDLYQYENIGLNIFKLQGRHSVVNGNPVKSVEHYMNEHFDGNLLDLLDHFNKYNSFLINIENKMLDGFILPFVEHDGYCKNDCSNCGYCAKWASEGIDARQFEYISKTTFELYDKIDDFNKLINTYIDRKVDEYEL